VDRVCNLLAQFPELGRGCEQYGAGLRRYPVDQYVIFFRPITNGIEVVRVLHGKRDFDAIFNP
jgi:toxin ParE1/3/4